MNEGAESREQRAGSRERGAKNKAINLSYCCTNSKFNVKSFTEKVMGNITSGAMYAALM